MNPQKKWRIDYGKHLFNALESLTQDLEAVFIGGSVGGKYVDKYSDLELCFIWKNEVDCDIIEQFHQKEKLNLFKSRITEVPLRAREYAMLKNDFQIDFYHYSISDFDRLTDFYKKDKVSLEIESLYYVLLNCKVLKGMTYIDKLKKMIEIYPLNLPEKNIKRYIHKFLKGDASLLIKRKDWILFYDLISDRQKLVFLTLLSLNKIYFPSYKNSWFYIEQLEIKPKSISLLYDGFYDLPPMKMWDVLIQIEQDILNLIKEIYPEIDFKGNLEFLSYKRQAKEDLSGLIN